MHGGHLPNAYFPEWFHERSVIFLKRLLRNLPDDFQIAAKNVLGDMPERLLNIVMEVGDPRMGICLDIGYAGASASVRVTDWINCRRKQALS